MNENDIRDGFAAAALPQLIAKLGITPNNDGIIARTAYSIADAMMAERAKRL
jgi:hypothetical protein